MGELYGKIEDKSKEIAKLKVAMDDVNHQIIEKDKEISQVSVPLDSSRDEIRDAQRKIDLAFKESSISLSF